MKVVNITAALLGLVLALVLLRWAGVWPPRNGAATVTKDTRGRVWARRDSRGTARFVAAVAVLALALVLLQVEAFLADPDGGAQATRALPEPPSQKPATPTDTSRHAIIPGPPAAMLVGAGQAVRAADEAAPAPGPGGDDDAPSPTAPAQSPPAAPAHAEEAWVESRFTTGCEPGPFQPPPPPLPAPLPDAPGAAQAALLRVDLAAARFDAPILGAGFNLEHGLWSCPAFHRVFERELFEPFRPALARVDSGMLPAAPPELAAEALHPAVYQAVLASEPYRHSWDFLRYLNRLEVPLVLGVWGGPAQFTHDGDRFGTLLPAHYDDYIEYVLAVVDFIVRRQGVAVWAVTIANEPDGGDGNRIPPDGLAYIARQLASRLAPYGVKLYGPDTASARHAMDYLPLLLDDPVIAEALAFVGFHQYHPTLELTRAIEYVRARRPELPVIVTEYTSFVFGDLDAGQEASDEEAFMLDVLSTALHHYAYGADAALYWDAADYLQPGRNAVTRWGLLRGPAHAFAPRIWYHAFRQVLSYLTPGSVIVDTPPHGATDLVTLAVLSPRGELSVFLLNAAFAPVDVALELSDGAARAGTALAVIRTDAAHRAELTGVLSVVDGAAALSLPPRSVTTLAGSVTPPERPDQ
jgi:hypothetical protein